MGILTDILKKRGIKTSDPGLCVFLKEEKNKLYTGLIEKENSLTDILKKKKTVQNKIFLKNKEIVETERNASQLTKDGSTDDAKELFIVSAGLRSEEKSLDSQYKKLNKKYHSEKSFLTDLKEDINEIDNIIKILDYQNKVGVMKNEIGKLDDRTDNLVSKIKKESSDTENGDNTDFSDPERFAEEKMKMINDRGK